MSVYDDRLHYSKNQITFGIMKYVITVIEYWENNMDCYIMYIKLLSKMIL